jgi:hypothetical protein
VLLFATFSDNDHDDNGSDDHDNNDYLARCHNDNDSAVVNYDHDVHNYFDNHYDDRTSSASYIRRDDGRCGTHLDQLRQRGRDSRNLNRVERDSSDHMSDSRFYGVGRQRLVVSDCILPMEQQLLRVR